MWLISRSQSKNVLQKQFFLKLFLMSSKRMERVCRKCKYKINLTLHIFSNRSKNFEKEQINTSKLSAGTCKCSTSLLSPNFPSRKYNRSLLQPIAKPLFWKYMITASQLLIQGMNMQRSAGHSQCGVSGRHWVTFFLVFSIALINPSVNWRKNSPHRLNSCSNSFKQSLRVVCGRSQVIVKKRDRWWM